MPMKTVMIIGAGLTRAARPSSSIRHRPPLDCDFFEIASRISPKSHNSIVKCLESLVGDYADTLQRSLETATTYLYIKAIDSKKGSPYHAGFLRLIEILNVVLAETTNPIKVGPASLTYRLVLGELDRVDCPEDLTVITFNYDLLVERTLEAISEHGREGVFWFPGCYRLKDADEIAGIDNSPEFSSEEYDHEGVELLKLHGSMNWQSLHNSRKPTPQALFRTNRTLNIVDSTKIATSLVRKSGSRKLYGKPIIVPPISGKRGMMQEDVLALWKKAGKALHEADRVVIAGYSCPPLDLEARILISENLRSNEEKRVYVIDPNPGVVSNFVDLCGIDHTTVYRSVRDWIRDTPAH